MLFDAVPSFATPAFYAGIFFFGFEFNPRLAGIDVKMLLYVLGAAGLLWNLLSALALRFETHGSLSRAIQLYAAMLSWFICEYMLAEVVHLYTYDLFCEKMGFKLIWGCLAFYPFFYCVGVWGLVEAPPSADLSPAACAACAALFLGGWLLTRGANLQKFAHKTRPEAERGQPWHGLSMAVVPGTGLLCGGFWGVARHVNYFGEILQAVALALPGHLLAATTARPLYYGVLPWLYPLYYVALFVPRQMDDDKQMRAKYGPAAFGQYERRVPYRIVPGLW